MTEFPVVLMFILMGPRHSQSKCVLVFQQPTSEFCLTVCKFSSESSNKGCSACQHWAAICRLDWWRKHTCRYSLTTKLIRDLLLNCPYIDRLQLVQCYLPLKQHSLRRCIQNYHLFSVPLLQQGAQFICKLSLCALCFYASGPKPWWPWGFPSTGLMGSDRAKTADNSWDFNSTWSCVERKKKIKPTFKWSLSGLCILSMD